MKRFITFTFALSFVLYLSSVSGFGQGKGGGRGPTVSGAARETHAPEINRGQGRDNDHSKAADHDRGNVAKDKTADKSTTDKTTRQADVKTSWDRNPELKTRLTGMLPAGTDLTTASSGFKNDGQFIAALHVSKNLNIPFGDMKAKMTGTEPMSLGQSVHTLRPTLSDTEVKKEVEKAEKEAKEDKKVKKTIS